jgi:tetrahydromethanopterin S-methyltransferase subunit G
MHATPLEVRMAHIEGAFEQINERLGNIDRHFESIDRRFESIDRRFDQIDSRFNWVIGIIVGTWMTTILTVLFHR